MIVNTEKPLIFVGTNSNIYKLYELSESAGFKIAGIIDDDYYGKKQFNNIPILYTEQELVENHEQLGQKYQFICATNWIPDKDNITIRNKEKRHRLIGLLDQLEVTVSTVISPLAQVSNYAEIGKGVFIDAFSVVEPMVKLDDHCSLYTNSYVGHHSVVGRNTVVQRNCFITSHVTIENDVYLGLCSKICRSDIKLSKNTFLHPDLMLLRGTEDNEEISLVGKDLRKVYHNPQEF